MVSPYLFNKAYLGTKRDFAYFKTRTQPKIMPFNERRGSCLGVFSSNYPILFYCTQSLPTLSLAHKNVLFAFANNEPLAAGDAKKPEDRVPLYFDRSVLLNNARSKASAQYRPGKAGHQV